MPTLIIPEIAFDSWELVPKWFTLEKRSGTLGGSLPIRAARFCPPVVQGSAAGYQVRLMVPLPVRLHRGEVSFDIDAAAAPLIGQECPAAIESLVDAGHLVKRGFWHRLFKDGPIALRGKRILIWTGVMMRPTSPVALWVTRAFNRHSHVEVVDHVIGDASGFTPLVIELDVASLSKERLVMYGEVGCVTPLWPGAQIHKRSLREVRELGERLVDFHDAEYARNRHTDKAGKYVRHKVAAVPPAAEMGVDIGTWWPKDHVSVARLSRRFHPGGATTKSPEKAPIEVANIFSGVGYDCTYDGHFFDATLTVPKGALERSANAWRELRGDDSFKGHLNGGAFFRPGSQGEAHLNVISPALVSTPDGWSMLFDGERIGPTWGMRGVIDTDWYPGVATVYQFHGPGRLVVEPRTLLLRGVPVPRALLASKMTKRAHPQSESFAVI